MKIIIIFIHLFLKIFVVTHSNKLTIRTETFKNSGTWTETDLVDYLEDGYKRVTSSIGFKTKKKP